MSARSRRWAIRWNSMCALIVYQLGGLFTGEVAFNGFTVVAIALLLGILYLLFRKGYTPDSEAVDSDWDLEGA